MSAKLEIIDLNKVILKEKPFFDFSNKELSELIEVAKETADYLVFIPKQVTDVVLNDLQAELISRN